MCKVDHSRRSFLRTASLTSMAGFYASPFLIGLNSLAAMAQGSGLSDYRALVCVFLQGGNDGHGTVIATDPTSFSAFTQARSGAPGLAYPMNELLPITSTCSATPGLRIRLTGSADNSAAICSHPLLHSHLSDLPNFNRCND